VFAQTENREITADIVLFPSYFNFSEKLFEKIKTAELDYSMMCTHYISEANVHQRSSGKCRTQTTWIKTNSQS
jgi:hypothetical protein